MPQTPPGIMVFFDEERRADLLRDRAEGEYEPFSDALSVRDWEIGGVSIALLSFSPDSIHFISIARKKKQVVTSKNRVEFSSIVSLDSVPIAALEQRIHVRLQPHFVRVSQGVGGLIPHATWQALLEALRSERPNLASEIDRLLSLLKFSDYRLVGDAAEILQQERDAVGIALDIFSGSNKLRDRVLGEWAPNEDQISDLDDLEKTARLIVRPGSTPSFLNGIPAQYTIQEESALQHDLFNWPGMTPMHQAGASVFKSGDRRLDVIYANRNDLEHTLGVDLLYYNEAYELFVLVQYKLMRDEGNLLVYRPDAQLRAELQLMEDFSRQYSIVAAITSHEHYRLSADGFMLKLVPRKGLRPATGELIKGMYVTREYMQFLLSPHGPRGPAGGTQITFENSPRYLTNSQFTSMVYDGWLGTRGIQTYTLREMVERFYETGRALVVARERRPARRRRADAL